MAYFSQKLDLETKRQFEILDITEKIKQAVGQSGLSNGIVTVFCPHTTASVRVNHNEPLLLQDVMKMLYRLVPVDANYAHDLFEIRQKVSANERSNGHAHVKSFLLGSSQTIPLEKNALMLGQKQSVFFVEMDGGRPRQVIISIAGE